MTNSVSWVELPQGIIIYFCNQCLRKRIAWGKKTRIPPWFKGLSEDMDPHAKPSSFSMRRQSKRPSIKKKLSGIYSKKRVTDPSEEDNNPILSDVGKNLKRRSVSVGFMERRVSSTTTDTLSSEEEEIVVGKGYVDPMSHYGTHNLTEVHSSSSFSMSDDNPSSSSDEIIIPRRTLQRLKLIPAKITANARLKTE